MNNTWICTICTVENQQVAKCNVCMAWCCATCTMINFPELSECAMCGVANYQPIVSIIANRRVSKHKPHNPNQIFECDCKTGAYCGVHSRLFVFQEYLPRAASGYPESVDDIRYIGSIIECHRIFPMISSPAVKNLLSNTSAQHAGDAIIEVNERYPICLIHIAKSCFGGKLEAIGPSRDTFRRFYDHVYEKRQPICIEIITSDPTDTKSEFSCHGAILVIMPPSVVRGRIYILDPNGEARIKEFNSSAIENVLKKMLPRDDRFEFIEQCSWLRGRTYSINGSYESLGISSGWCRTISILISGLITRRDNPIKPEDVLEYIAKQPEELRIMMYDATIRHVVACLLTPDDCKKMLEIRHSSVRKVAK